MSGPPQRTYHLAGLRGVQIGMRSVQVRWRGVAGYGIATLVIAVMMWISLPDPALYTLGLLVFAGGMGITWVILPVATKPRTYDLVAYQNGNRVLLFSSSDQKEFHRIKRALIRALENQRDSSDSHPTFGMG
ncbi:DUF6232 family protein [Actinoplanes sp. CA-252034]|uniref:DUF6232 family protein n=1 Tax=Actinoplanes sp. CA-252034 TaxID=3239906 RepID=UPI003D95C70E